MICRVIFVSSSLFKKPLIFLLNVMLLKNFRPPLQRNDSRIQGGPGGPQPQPQQFQGQPRPFQGQGPGQAPQFRPPNFQQQIQQQLQQNQQQRFAPPGSQGPNPNQQGPPAGQPLFRPQQRFVAVNPPGTVRPNFRPPGPPGPQGVQGPPIRQRPPGPGLPQQQSFAGALPTQRSQEGNLGPPELHRSATLESDTGPSNERHEEKENPKISSPEMSPAVVAPPKPQVQPPVQQPQTVTSSPPPAQNPSPTPIVPPQQNAQNVPKSETSPVAPIQVTDNAPPSTLQLNSSLDSKISSSPSPQPESVIEVKKLEEKPKSNADNKPPRVPKTPTRGGSTARTPSRNKKGSHIIPTAYCLLF